MISVFNVALKEIDAVKFKFGNVYSFMVRVKFL